METVSLPDGTSPVAEPARLKCQFCTKYGQPLASGFFRVLFCAALMDERMPRKVIKRLTQSRSIILACLFGLTACGGGGGDTAPAPPAPPPSPPPPPVFMPQTVFANISAASGITHTFSVAGSNTGEPAKMGGGLSATDVDRDGDIDLYIVGGDGAPNALYLNNGGNNYSDAAGTAGIDFMHLGSGPAFGDIDSDGDLDLFIGAVEGDSVYLLRNDNGTFTDVTATSGLIMSAENSISASFSDYDLDADLDLFVAHWGNDQQADTETLWDNNGDGTFTSASIPSGIAGQLITQVGSQLVDWSFAPMMSDIDRDGDPDMLLASDFKTSKILLNNGDGTFTDITDRDVIIDRNGMGSAAADYDNDGDMDWYVTSIYEPSAPNTPNPGNRLYRNDGGGVFTDVSDAAGVAEGGWGWGVCMEDFDNDGDVDIFHVNGWWQLNPRDEIGSYQYADDPVRYFENQGDGTFVEAANAAGLIETGQGRGVACFDSDRDGDQDIVITNNQDTDSVVVFRNDLAVNNHYLTVKLNGNGLNTDAIGALVEITDGSSVQIREIRASNHFVSQNPAEAHFGLGSASTVDMTIFWPDGSQSIINNVAANQYLSVDQ